MENVNRRPVALMLVVLGAIARLVPHPWNFAPVGGMLGDREAPKKLGELTVEQLLEQFAKGRAEYEKKREGVLLYR